MVPKLLPIHGAVPAGSVSVSIRVLPSLWLPVIAFLLLPVEAVLLLPTTAVLLVSRFLRRDTLQKFVIVGIGFPRHTLVTAPSLDAQVLLLVYAWLTRVPVLAVLLMHLRRPCSAVLVILPALAFALHRAYYPVKDRSPVLRGCSSQPFFKFWGKQIYPTEVLHPVQRQGGSRLGQLRRRHKIGTSWLPVGIPIVAPATELFQAAVSIRTESKSKLQSLSRRQSYS